MNKSQIMNRAWEIRRLSARKWKCKARHIDMGACMSIAHRESKNGCRFYPSAGTGTARVEYLLILLILLILLLGILVVTADGSTENMINTEALVWSLI